MILQSLLFILFCAQELILYQNVNLYNLLEMDPAALKSLNRTNDRDSMSDQYPQTAAQQPRRILFPVFSSL